MKARLENWYISMVLDDPYKAPEQGRPVLVGNVYGHERFEDGASITTGTIRSFSSDDMTASTNRTEYTLGKIEPGFEKYLKDNNHELSQYNK